MNFPINLDHQPLFDAAKVDRVGRDGMFPAKFPSLDLPIAKPLPNRRGKLMRHLTLVAGEIDRSFRPRRRSLYRSIPGFQDTHLPVNIA
jgi:hypothetical protein